MLEVVENYYLPVYRSYGTKKIPHKCCNPRANPKCEAQNQVYAYSHQLPIPDQNVASGIRQRTSKIEEIFRVLLAVKIKCCKPRMS